jgi:hypothetical protein
MLGLMSSAAWLMLSRSHSPQHLLLCACCQLVYLTMTIRYAVIRGRWCLEALTYVRLEMMYGCGMQACEVVNAHIASGTSAGSHTMHYKIWHDASIAHILRTHHAPLHKDTHSLPPSVGRLILLRKSCTGVMR